MQDNNILKIDTDWQMNIPDEEGKQLQDLLKEFEQCYADNKYKPVLEWLEPKMQEHLPDRSQDEIHRISAELVDSLKITETNHEDLQKAVSKGRSKESWFASQMKKATSSMSTQESAEYLSNLDATVKNTNEALYDTITTKAGNISQNPNLDGFIAEQYHAQTFNMNAEAAGSKYRAKVLEPDGKYTKNSVDIVIVDGDGKVVSRYQSKYCKDSAATEKAFEKGDYRGQQKLVPEEQNADIAKKSTDVLVAPDGTTSNPLTKNRAEQMRKEAQSGNWNELNWNEYAMKDLAKGVGKQAGVAALQGLAIGAGMDIAQKLWNGEEIEGKEVIADSLKTGADFGVKAAAAGALKVAAEKEIINIIPKGTPASAFSNIAFVAVEDVKVARKVASGELSVLEGIEQIEETTVSAVAGIAAMEKGAEIGASIGAVLGAPGAIVGGVIGGTVGYMAGSTFGQTVIQGVKKTKDKAVDCCKQIFNNGKKTVTKAFNKAYDFVRAIF